MNSLELAVNDQVYVLTPDHGYVLAKILNIDQKSLSNLQQNNQQNNQKNKNNQKKNQNNQKNNQKNKNNKPVSGKNLINSVTVQYLDDYIISLYGNDPVIYSTQNIKKIVPVNTETVKPTYWQYMNSREFPNWVNEIFGTYKSCDSTTQTNKKFKLFKNQEFLRDYLGTTSPYRGLLLYHGTGAGKCVFPDTQIYLTDNVLSANDIFTIYKDPTKCIADTESGYWYKTKQTLYVNSYDTSKKQIIRCPINWIFAQYISEYIEEIELENGLILKKTKSHKLYDGNEWENNQVIGNDVSITNKLLFDDIIQIEFNKKQIPDHIQYKLYILYTFQLLYGNENHNVIIIKIENYKTLQLLKSYITSIFEYFNIIGKCDIYLSKNIMIHSKAYKQIISQFIKPQNKRSDQNNQPDKITYLFNDYNTSHSLLIPKTLIYSKYSMYLIKIYFYNILTDINPLSTESNKSLNRNILRPNKYSTDQISENICFEDDPHILNNISLVLKKYSIHMNVSGSTATFDQQNYINLLYLLNNIKLTEYSADTDQSINIKLNDDVPQISQSKIKKISYFTIKMT